MRHQGKLTDWNDERGFGFITPSTGGSRVFVHISSFPSGQGRPTVDGLITYTVTGNGQNRLRAEEVLFQGASTPGSARERGLVPALGVSSFFFALLAGLAILGLVPPVILGFYMLMSAVSFAMYGMDKSAARSGGRRTAEATLHLFGVAGGWPGALVAQRVFRHKTKKQPFQMVFWCAIVANCAALVWVLFAEEAASIRVSLGFT